VIIKNVNLVLPDREIPNGTIGISGNRIDSLEPLNDEQEVIDGTGLIALPGLIDLHIHGAGGVSITDDDPERLNKLAEVLPRFGITGFLWTTMAVPLPEMDLVMKQMAEFIPSNKSVCHGINIEGSFISPNRAGSHETLGIFEPDIELVERWQKLSGNSIRLMTIAPEKTSEEFMKYITSQNIIASVGHSCANYEQTLTALQQGASYFTHLGNATGMPHQREPGLVGAALLDDKSVIEIICDGIHLHPAMVQLFIKLKGWDKVVIVSDGTCVMGMPPGKYPWYNNTATFDGESLKLDDQTIAGGVIPLNKALLNLTKFTGCTLSAATRMTSLKPARILGIDHDYGSITPGKIANLVLVDKDFNVVYTIINGKVVYSAL